MSPNATVRRSRQGRRRALVKTVCYRLVMIAVTVAVAWAVVGDVGDAVSVGLVANLVKTGTYYAYERLWDRVAWGLAEP